MEEMTSIYIKMETLSQHLLSFKNSCLEDPCKLNMYGFSEKIFNYVDQ
jgi:hypothetical protein